MSYLKEKVTRVHHWNETLFSFNITRNTSYRFKNGHFVMLGIETDNKPLVRAYSIASANWEPELEFLSIKLPDGELTSKLQHLAIGDEVLIGIKPVGTLVADLLLPGKNLWLLSTGTGLAPFMSIIKDPEIYDQYDKVILVHGVRLVSELAYKDTIESELPKDEFLGEMIREKLLYYPTVTREAFKNQGRITDLLTSGEMNQRLGLPPLSVDDDRFMICGNQFMLDDLCQILDDFGFVKGTNKEQGHYTIERAFVEHNEDIDYQ